MYDDDEEMYEEDEEIEDNEDEDTGWSKADVVNRFYNQDQVMFGKGFKLFEDVYEELKDELDLIREEDGDTVIVRPRKTKWQIIKEVLDERKKEFEENERKKTEGNK